MLWFLIIVVLTIFLALIIRFVQPDLIYGLRQGLVMVRANKAFLDKMSGRSDVNPDFLKLLMHEAKWENRDNDENEILERVIKIKELYRILDLRRPVPEEFRKEQKPQLCIIELASLLGNLGMRVQPNVEHNHTVVNDRAILRFIGNQIRLAQNEKEFTPEESVDEWFIEYPISIEQVIEIMIAAVVGLAHRQQAAREEHRYQERGGINFVDAWTAIKKLEKRLRMLLRSELQKQYKVEEKVHERIKEALGEQSYNECLQNMEKSRRRTPEIALDFLDFVYLGQLETIFFKEWPVFSNIFPKKEWLKSRFEKVIQVRNELAHNRAVKEGEQALVIGYCSEIINRVENYESNNT